MKTTYEPFDLEKAKLGAKIVTRDGNKARIICFDARDKYPIVALVESTNGQEYVHSYSLKGFYYPDESPYGTDLMIDREVFNIGDVVAWEGHIGILANPSGLTQASFVTYIDMDLGTDTICNKLNYWNDSNLRLATDEEIKNLEIELASHGVYWNSTKMCIEYFPKKYPFKRGQIVLSKNPFTDWHIGYFMDYRPDLSKPYITSCGDFVECRDYDSNKELFHGSKDI